MRDGRKADREPSSRCGLPHTAYSVLHMYGHLAKRHTLLAGGQRRSGRSEEERAPALLPQGIPELVLGKGRRRRGLCHLRRTLRNRVSWEPPVNCLGVETRVPSLLCRAHTGRGLPWWLSW